MCACVLYVCVSALPYACGRAFLLAFACSVRDFCCDAFLCVLHFSMLTPCAHSGGPIVHAAHTEEVAVVLCGVGRRVHSMDHHAETDLR